MITLYFACQTPNEPSETKLEDTVVTVDEPSQEPTQEPSIEIETCDEVKTLPKKLRRLTDTQYKNAVIQILDLEFDDASFKNSFPSTIQSKTFHTFAANNNVTQAGSESILFASEEFINLWKIQHSICENQNQECALSYLKERVEQAYRRSVSEEEFEIYEDMILNWGLPVNEVLPLALQVLLQSPQFLYIHPAPTESINDTMSKISSSERLALLTLFLHNTLPSEEQSEIYANRLQTRQDVRDVAQELLLLPQTSHNLYLFHRDWLHLFRLYEGTKDPDVYPSYTSDWPNFAERELELFIEDIFWNGHAKFEDLLFSTEAWIHPHLREVYNTSDVLEDEYPDIWNYTSELSEQRKGILTRPAFLMAQSYTATSSPVRRGAWVLEQMLCEELNPPPDVDMEIPPPQDDAETIRDRLAIHSEDPYCYGCHQRIDPIGFSFENYGALGEYRQNWENGIPVDASGSIAEGEFDHVTQMLTLLANSPKVQTCYVQNWMEYALGRPLEEEDQCDLQRITQRFVSTNGHVPSLLLDIASSDAFLYTRTE